MAASLALAKGANLNCAQTAGVKELYTIPIADVDSLTASNSVHSLTNIVFATAGNGFGKIEFKRGECELTQKMEQQNEVVVNFAVPNPTAEQLFQLEAIRKSCEQYMVARTYDDKFIFVGWDAISGDEAFARFQTAETTTGRAKTDANLTSFSMMAEQSELCRILTGISGATATTPAAIAAELIAATSV